MASILIKKLKSSKKELVFAVSAILFMLIFVEIIHERKGIPYENLCRDPNAIAGFPKYFGLMSQFGILIWSASCVLCFFTYFLIHKTRELKKISNFFISFGLFSLTLCLDDTFMLHEELAHRGLYEQFFYLFYGIMLLTFVFSFWKIIFSTNIILLGISATFLGLSIFADQFYGSNYILDDSFKLSGIIFWFAYVSNTVFFFLKLHFSKIMGSFHK